MSKSIISDIVAHLFFIQVLIIFIADILPFKNKLSHIIPIKDWINSPILYTGRVHFWF